MLRGVAPGSSESLREGGLKEVLRYAPPCSSESLLQREPKVVQRNKPPCSSESLLPGEKEEVLIDAPPFSSESLLERANYYNGYIFKIKSNLLTNNQVIKSINLALQAEVEDQITLVSTNYHH